MLILVFFLSIFVLPNEATPQPTTGKPHPDDVNRSLRKGLEYLKAAQNKSGGWKSEYYGNLKQGAATTSLVLFALSHIEPELLKGQREAVANAFSFLKKGISKQGYVANESGPDYANYATALVLLADRNFERRVRWRFLNSEERNKLVDFLVRSQLDETHGLDPQHVDYGGWDLSGWLQEPRESAGTNVSVTSFVLLALKQESSRAVNEAQKKARPWLARVRNADHGYFFHPRKDHLGNKAGWNGASDALSPKDLSPKDLSPKDLSPKELSPKSYGTATVDGIRALRSLGSATGQGKWTPAEPKEKSVRSSSAGKSAAWIEKNSAADPNFIFVPGFEIPKSGRDASWGQGLLYYYLMNLGLEKEIFSRPFLEKCQKRIPKYLLAQQAKNGSWSNTSSRMREDDPLIATACALVALSRFTEAP